VKKSAMVLVCVFLLACWAQAQPSDPETPAGDAGAPSGQQAPPPATPPPAAPPAGQAQPQTGPSITAAPELPKYPDVRMPGESGVWIGIIASEPTASPIFNAGRATTSTYTTSTGNDSLITLQGRPKLGEGVDIGVAVGQHNALVLSGFSTRASGDFTSTTSLTLWSQTYSPGVLIATDYRLQTLKLSFEYLTWPYPVESRHFRLKTLWQVQYVNMSTGFNAPLLPITNSSGTALTNSSGTPITYAAAGSRWFMSPTLGLGVAEYFSKFVRFELNGSAFAVPRSWTIWDSDGSINLRFGHFELGGGVRAFHVKTSTNAPFYTRATWIEPQVALRWYSK